MKDLAFLTDNVLTDNVLTNDFLTNNALMNNERIVYVWEFNKQTWTFIVFGVVVPYAIFYYPDYSYEPAFNS